MKKTVFIGAGAMGGAILKGALQAGLLSKEAVFVKEHTESFCEQVRSTYGVAASTTYPDWKEVGTVILAVKPQVLPAVLGELKNIPAGMTVISIAAGITLETLESALPQCAVYRVMPNTPAAVGAGMTAIAVGSEGTEEKTSFVVSLFEALGEAVVVSEVDLDRLGALSGAGPGYCFVILDAMADAGVKLGLPRALAIKAAAQTLYGAGKMAVETGTHPAQLRDQVTSPGGTTIAGITAMEAQGLRTALHAGIEACYTRSNEIGKKH